MKKILMMVFCILLASCTKTIQNEEEAVLKVAVHDEKYGQQLNELWKETYPDQPLEISVVHPQEINEKIADESINEFDVYMVEDQYIPKLMNQLLELDSETEVTLNSHFNQVFDTIKKVYQPLIAQGINYYMIDIDVMKKNLLTLDDFSSMEKIAKLNKGFYYYDDPRYTFSFLTGNVNYFPGNEKNRINFKGNSFKEALNDYQTILHLISCHDPASYDNWFIHDTYMSGFVNDSMQVSQDEQINSKNYMYAKLPTVNGHQLYTQAISYGYVVKKDTSYPNAARNLLKLIHSKQGVQLLCNNEILIPLIVEDEMSEFTFETAHMQEKAMALNAALSRNWVGVENKRVGAIDYLMFDETLSKLQMCDLNKIDECVNELDQEYQEWLK